MCDFKKKSLPRGHEIGVAATKLIIDRMNENLREFKDTSECAVLNLNTDAKLEVLEFEEKSEVKIYQIKWETLPGNGKFSGFITRDSQSGNMTILSERFPRLDRYAPQSKCAEKAKWESYCFCKYLLHTTTMVPPQASMKSKATTKALPQAVTPNQRATPTNIASSSTVSLPGHDGFGLNINVTKCG